MRRREKYADLVWLKGLETDNENGQPAPRQLTGAGVTGNIQLLTHDMKALVEIEPQGDAYHVRVFPRQGQAGGSKLVCALYYTGTDLGNILATAAAEALLIYSERAFATMSSREVARWVAP